MRVSSKVLIVKPCYDARRLRGLFGVNKRHTPRPIPHYFRLALSKPPQKVRRKKMTYVYFSSDQLIADVHRKIASKGYRLAGLPEFCGAIFSGFSPKFSVIIDGGSLLQEQSRGKKSFIMIDHVEAVTPGHVERIHSGSFLLNKTNKSHFLSKERKYLVCCS